MRANYIFFIIAYPFFILYTGLVSNNLIEPHLKGYIGAVFPVVLILMMLVWLIKKRLVSYLDVGIILFFATLMLRALIGLSTGADSEVVKGHVASFIYFLVTYFIYKSFDFETKKKDKILVLAFLMSLFIIAITLPPLNVITNIYNVYDGFSYQFISACSLVILFTLILKIKEHKYYGLLIVFVFVFVFFTGARTELIQLFVFSLVLYIALNPVKLVIYGFFLSCLFAYIIDAFSDFKILETARIFELITKGSSAGSSSERIDMLKNALEIIEINPLWGSYASYRPGEYAHSIINIWQDFGLFHFIIVLTLLIYGVFFCIRQYFKSSLLRFEWAIAMCIGISLLPVMLFSKGVEYLVFSMFLGLTVNLAKKEKKYDKIYTK